MTAPFADPLDLFRELFARAAAREATDATAAALATVGASGAPAVRIVLCKGSDERGLVFFTNYESRKARELHGEPRAALCFYWPTLGVQVRAEGPTERLTQAESDAYFATRPRESQLAAWASRQSEPLASRDELGARYAEADARFPGSVPRPPFWGGYRLVPSRIEHWQAGEHRLHHRTVYERAGNGWAASSLFP
ncbi:MAG TPA: pyridoxamine 5'-phosphate oxidase [Vicinamibacteria bacterium]|nr:pyridoxamine 5'-phosphate oxidase [Vicinamibacteria bacterium]